MEGPYSPSEATLVGSSEGQVSRQGSEAGSREGTCIKSRSIRVRLAALVFVLQQVVKEGAHTHLARPSTYAHLSASLHLARPHLYLIGLLTHAGPLLTGLLVGVACARGHRARWAAVGQGVAALAALMTAATALSATPTPQASRYCNVNRLMALATDPDNAALATQDPASTSCLLPDTVVVVVWVVASLITGVGVSTGYILGFPYIDDGVKREEAPMYLAVLVTSGAFGKVIGEWLGSVSQSDPEFAGAWWAGQLVWAASWLTLAAITLTLPRNLSPELKTDRTAPSPVLHPGQSCTGAASGLPRGVALAPPPPTFVPEEEEDEEEEEEEEEEETVEERELGYETDVERDSGYSMEEEEVVWREEEEEEEERKRREKKEEEGEKVMKKKKKKKKKFNVVCCCTGWWGAVRGLAGNRVLGLSVGVDLLVGCGVGALSSWGPALYPHPPQADQYYTGISSTTAIIVGVGVGGVWVVRCRPRARTLAFLLAVLVGVMAAAHAPLAALTCGGEEGLPGVLSMDGSTLALHRACSEGCYCDAGGAYQPVCVRDGPLMLPYFSPCHAGCPPPPLGQPLGNCTCGSRAAKVTPGPCHPCPTHLLHTCLSCLAASLVPVALLINLLLALRAVSKEDKTVALGLKLSLWSLGRLVGPLLVGALVGESCLVRGAACGGRGGRGWGAKGGWMECYLYESSLLGYILHGTCLTAYLLAALLSLFLAGEAARIDLFGDPHLSPHHGAPNPFSRAPDNSIVRRSIKKVSMIATLKSYTGSWDVPQERERGRGRETVGRIRKVSEEGEIERERDGRFKGTEMFKRLNGESEGAGGGGGGGGDGAGIKRLPSVTLLKTTGV